MRISMNFTLNRDRAAVWRAFDNPDNLKKWQPNLTAFERVSGTPGQPGAVSRLTYVENGRTIQMTETIMVRREPEEFGGTYDVGSALNTVQNRFVEAGGATRWEIQADFAFRGIWKLLGLIFGPLIRKRIRADSERFKIKLEAGELG